MTGAAFHRMDVACGRVEGCYYPPGTRITDAA